MFEIILFVVLALSLSGFIASVWLTVRDLLRKRRSISRSGLQMVDIEKLYDEACRKDPNIINREPKTVDLDRLIQKRSRF